MIKSSFCFWNSKFFINLINLFIKITFINYPHDSLEITVEDSGTGKNKISAAELQRIVQDQRNPNYVNKGIRGRGLSKIVSEWTDELDFSDNPSGGIKVRIKKYLKDPRLKEMAQYLESPTHLVLS